MVFGAGRAYLPGRRQPRNPGLPSFHALGAQGCILAWGMRGTHAWTLPGLRSLRVLGPAPSRAGVVVARERKGLAEQGESVGPSSHPTWLAGSSRSHVGSQH